MKVVDLTYLEAMSGDDIELMKEMMGLFISQIPELVNEMRTFYEKQDWISLGKVAHKAKSSVSIMGMDDLAKDMKDFETYSKSDEKKDEFINYINKFEEVTKLAIEDLQEFLATLKD